MRRLHIRAHCENACLGPSDHSGGKATRANYAQSTFSEKYRGGICDRGFPDAGHSAWPNDTKVLEKARLCALYMAKWRGTCDTRETHDRTSDTRETHLTRDTHETLETCTT